MVMVKIQFDKNIYKHKIIKLKPIDYVLAFYKPDGQAARGKISILERL